MKVLRKMKNPFGRHQDGSRETGNTKRYLYAVTGHLIKMSALKTREGVSSILDHLMGLTHAIAPDTLFTRHVIPYLFLRLSQDRECFAFLQWQKGKGIAYASQGDHSYQNLLKGSEDNISEPIELQYFGPKQSLDDVALILLKIRLLQTLKVSLRNLNFVMKDIHLPQEIWDHVERCVIQSIIRDDRAHKRLGDVMKTVDTQIHQIFLTYQKADPKFWPTLILSCDQHQSIEDPRKDGVLYRLSVTYHRCRAWRENPWALNIIRDMTRELDGATNAE